MSRHPTGNERSAQRGSLKAAPSTYTGQGILSTIANTVGYPIQHMMDTVAASGEQAPGHRGILGGLEDTASAAFDEIAIPGLIRGGVKGLWPAAKAAAGYAAGSNIVEKGGETLGLPEEVSRGAGMLSGAGGAVGVGKIPRIPPPNAGVKAALTTGLATGVRKIPGASIPLDMIDAYRAATPKAVTKIAAKDIPINTINQEDIIQPAQGLGPIRPPVQAASSTIPVQKVTVPETGLGAQGYSPIQPPLSPKAETLPAQKITRPTPRVVGPIRPPLKETPNVETSTETPKEAKSTSVEAEKPRTEGSEGTKVEETETSQPKNVAFDKLLGEHTDWDGKSQLQYPHLKSLAEKLGTTPTQVGRIASELGYDIAESKYHKGYGLNRSGKKDFGSSDIEFKTLLKAFKSLSEN